MPYQGEHAARINDPGQYVRMRRQNDKFGPGIDVIWGVTRDGKSEVQAIRFDSKKFTVAQAQAWLKENDYTDIVEFEPAIAAARTMRCYSLDDSAVETVSESTGPDGLRRMRLKKELARDGEYVHPETGKAFTIDADMRANWIRQFHQMRINGVRVPFQTGHAIDNQSAKESLGEVYDMETEGESAYGYIEVIGDDAIREALRNDVSIYSPPEWVDGKANVYSQPIVHVAATPYPVIPRLSDWQVIAAARRGAAQDSTIIASDVSATNTVDTTIRTEGAMDLKDVKKLARALGIDDLDSLTEENAAEKLTAAAKGLTDGRKATEKMLEKVKALKLSLDDPHPEVTKVSRENREMKLGRLVEGSKLTPALADKVREKYMSDEGMALSLGRGGDDFDFLVSILSDNDPVKLAEQSGPQTMELSFSKDDVEKSPVVKAAEKIRASRTGQTK